MGHDAFWWQKERAAGAAGGGKEQQQSDLERKAERAAAAAEREAVRQEEEIDMQIALGAREPRTEEEERQRCGRAGAPGRGIHSVAVSEVLSRGKSSGLCAIPQDPQCFPAGKKAAVWIRDAGATARPGLPACLAGAMANTLATADAARGAWK